jgi:hypothetical protein
VQAAEGWVEAALRVLAWAGALLAGAALLAVAAALLAVVVRWLFSRTAGREPQPLGLDLLRAWKKLSEAARALLRRLRGSRSATELYGVLLVWGRWSGVVRRPSETALEYACRLAARFPAMRDDIVSVVEAFHREVYGGQRGGTDVTAARSALRRLRSPSLWPARLKGRFSGAG